MSESDTIHVHAGEAHVNHEHKKRFGISNLKKLAEEKIRLKHVLSGLIYLLIALVLFYPIALHMSSVAPGTGGDLYSNMWGMWWISYTLLHAPSSMWYTYLLFWPVGSNIAYFTTAPLASILTGPFQAISLTFAYNMIFFTGFVITGIGMFILADYITKNQYAAFFAGIIFAFSAYHTAAAVGHLDWMDIGWVPLVLYFFIRMLRDDRKYLYSIGMAFSFVFAVFMGDIEQGIMTLVLLFLVLVCYAVYPKTRKLVLKRKFIAALGVGVVATFIIGSWGFIPLLHGVLVKGGLQNVNSRNTLQNDAEWSDPILSFFLPSPYNGLIGGISSAYSSIYSVDPNERIAYIGYIAIILLLYGVFKNFKEARLWIIIAFVFGWLTLGPFIEFGGYVSSGIPGIYQLYHYIPGFSILQEADRFYVVFSIAIAMMAAFGMKSLIEKISKMNHRSRNSLIYGTVGILSIIFIIESAGIMTPGVAAANTTHITIPNFYNIIANSTVQFSVLQLPIIINNNIPFPDLAAGEASFYTVASHKPILGGYGGRINTTQELTLFSIPLAVAVYNMQNGNFTYTSPVNENYTAATLLSLYNYQTAFVVLNEQVLNASELTELYAYSEAVFGKPVYEDNSTIAFSTVNAINQSIYRQYVSYPLTLDWQPVSTFINGSVVNLWEPISPGLISVFAPYSNTTGIIRKVSSGVPYTINTTASFSAIAVGGSTRLAVDEPTSSGGYRTIATFNITNKLSSYSFSTDMVSGPLGNPLLFVSDGSGSIGISNITFSESK
jgi:hypothetical protein